jgi:hypothetical protein
MSDHPRTARYEGGRAAPSGYEPTNLADILDRILDKGLVIAGDISISLAQVELITIKIRLLLASADKAKEMGIDWWTRDPALSGAAAAQGDGEGDGDVEEENRALRQRVADLEQKLAGVLTGGESVASRSEPISAKDLLALTQQSTRPAPPAPQRSDESDESDESDDSDEASANDDREDGTDGDGDGGGSEESSQHRGSGKSSKSGGSGKSSQRGGSGKSSKSGDAGDTGGDEADASDGEEASGSSGGSDDRGGSGQGPES